MKRRAFTFIELIIVLAIISISLTVLVFRFSVIDKIGAESEIKTFVNDYSYARDKALSTGNEIGIDFEGNSYTIFSLIYQKYGKNYIAKKVVDTKRNLKYVKPLDINEIRFYPSGYVQINKTKEDHNFVFLSRKEQGKYWNFTIQAVGGYLNEKD